MSSTALAVRPPGLADPDACEVIRVDLPARPESSEPSNTLLEAVAERVLSPRELASWRTLGEPAPQPEDTFSRALRALRGLDRRAQWLAGRVTVKQAVCRLLDRRCRPRLSPADIEIATDESGRPFVTRLGTEGRASKTPPHRGGAGGGSDPWRTPDISIAHTAGTTVGIAVDSCQSVRVGVDIERVCELEDNFARVAFAPGEHRWFTGLDREAASMCMLRLWCAKEAAAKAIGLGLQGQPHSYLTQQYDPITGQAEIRYIGPGSPDAQKSASVQVNTIVLEDDHILALGALFLEPGHSAG